MCSVGCIESHLKASSFSGSSMDNKNGRHGVWRPFPFSGCLVAYILIDDTGATREPEDCVGGGD
jgi:hypothetical protein